MREEIQRQLAIALELTSYHLQQIKAKALNPKADGSLEGFSSTDALMIQNYVKTWVTANKEVDDALQDEIAKLSDEGLLEEAAAIMEKLNGNSDEAGPAE